MNRKKITYAEVKSRQNKDIASNVAEYYIYRYFSSPFTWVFVNLVVSPNFITISNFFLCIFGFYFLSRGTYFSIIFGLLFFILFKIMDMADGEVARIQNTKSVEGEYFDRISHYIYTCCLGFGLGFGLYKLYKNDIYIIFGFLFTFLFILENAMNDLLKAMLYKGFVNNINSGRSWAEGNIFSKLFGIIPFQGLIYSDTFTAPILIILAIIEYFVLGTIAAYLLAVSISKIIWITYFISKMKEKGIITKTLKSKIN